MHTGVCPLVIEERRRAKEAAGQASEDAGRDVQGTSEKPSEAYEDRVPANSRAGSTQQRESRRHPEEIPGVVRGSSLVEGVKPKFDKTTYQRAYMKAWRAKWRKPE